MPAFRIAPNRWISPPATFRPPHASRCKCSFLVLGLILAALTTADAGAAAYALVADGALLPAADQRALQVVSGPRPDVAGFGGEIPRSIEARLTTPVSNRGSLAF